MALNVKLNRVTNLPGKHDRQATLTFRGFTHKTKKMNTGPIADFGTYFRWPHYGQIVSDEVLTIKVYNCSKVFSNRLLGKLIISLQHLPNNGRLVLTEALVDKNYSITSIKVELDIRYQPAIGAAGPWDGNDFFSPLEDSSAYAFRNEGFEEDEEAEETARKKDKAAVRIGKKLVKGSDDDEDDDSYDESEFEISGITFTPVLSRCSVPIRDFATNPKPRNFQIAVTVIQAQKLVGVNINPVVHVKIGEDKRHTITQKSTNCPFYNQYFVFEYLEPREILFDKLIEIAVVHTKKIPIFGTRLGTFKIDAGTVYNQPDHRFLQKWAVITDPKDTRAGIKGFVKCNMSVVTRGDSMNAPPSTSSSQNDDIEKNLLLPKRIPAERPWSRLSVKIYKAEGLPSMNDGIMGSFSKIMGDKKVFIDPYVQVTFAGQQGETSVESDTNIPEWNEQVSFIELFPALARKIKIQILDDAHVGDVALATHFIDMQQISDPSKNAGFNPTFGPAWINLYGSPQNYTLRDVHRDLNEGLGEGIFYRGRILVAVTLEVFSNNNVQEKKPLQALKNAFSKLKMKKKSKKSKEKEAAAAAAAAEEAEGEGEEGDENKEQPNAVTVEVDDILPMPENALGVKEEFLLFGVLFEVTMIDPSIGNKPVKFEVSIGNYGKTAEIITKSSKKKEKLKAVPEERQGLLDTASEDELSVDLEEEVTLLTDQNGKSVTPAKRPESTEPDNSFSYIPLGEERPCVYVWSHFEDHSWRLYNSNWIVKIAERLERGLDEVEKLTRRPKSKPEVRLKQVLEEFVAGCRQYSLGAGKKPMARPNNLDQCRMKSVPHNLILLAKQALRASRRLTKQNVKEKMNEGRKILTKVRFLAKEPQCTLPDVLIWMFSNNKRIAYARIPAQNILYSVVEEEKGKDCGKISTVYFKIPGSYSGEIFAKAEIYMWLGVKKYAKNSTAELPEDYKLFYDKNGELIVSPTNNPPILLQRDDYRYFQLRAHLYQARGILPADDNGLSDPFAKVVFANYCQNTQVINETLAPMWNEMLVYDNLLMDGNKGDLRNDPPIIIINIYDQDKFGSPEFLGRAFATPIVTLLDEEEETEETGPKYSKPALQFFDIFKGNTPAGELIAVFELIELENKTYMKEPALPHYVTPQEPEYMDEMYDRYIIPQGIRPVLKEFRIEVLFWGLRHLKRINLFEVEQPQVRIECAGKKVESETILSYKEFPNFTELVKCVDVELPEQVYLHPPLSIFVVEKRAFGRSVLVGSAVVPHLMKFAPKELEEEMNDEAETKPKVKKLFSRLSSMPAVINVETDDKDSKFNPLNLVKDPLKSLGKAILKDEELEEERPDPEELDWWSKYYESIQELSAQMKAAEEDEEGENEEGGDGVNINSLDAAEEEYFEVEVVKPKRKPISTLKVCLWELEEAFDKFEDWLYVFPLYRGKALDDDDANDDDNFMGKYKGSFYIYPTAEATDEFKIMRGVPRNRPMKVLVRIYIVKATSLSPADPNGKADPYIVVKVADQTMDSKERYIPKQLNPVFGEVFEITVSFPVESELTISIFDHDLVGSDDLIGETKLDLENRFYSNHRANCGLALQYDVEGYNEWRDAFKPSQILSSLCKKHDLPAPEYRREEVKVNNKLFKIPNEAFPEEAFIRNKNQEEDVMLTDYDEHKALYVLQHWDEMPEYGTRLVPEHVEVRTLYNSESPGLSQGSLHMWIDMFPNDVPAPPPVNIKPRAPVNYELRVIIWNTDDVILDDINPFTGEPSSDIYVKGWIRGLEGEKQETDVHFNSLTGEGNFNWRFVYRFDYLPTEKEITYKKKESFFSLEESEFREPAVLSLQVWDYDRISANDFLGSIELNLSDMVRGAKTSQQCTIKMAKDKATPRFSIFRNKRMRGWWPFVKLKTEEDEEREEREAKQKKKKKKKKRRRNVRIEDVQYTDSSGNIYILAGKVEAEFQLLTVEEAEKSPVGLGRKEPEPLEKPNRPKTSFNWFVNPLKTFVFFIWKKYKKYIIALLIIAILTVFLVLILYTMPGYISQKIING
ncbi:fer-1-like protein 4 [Gastrophryne carolinensis]